MEEMLNSFLHRLTRRLICFVASSFMPLLYPVALLYRTSTDHKDVGGAVRPTFDFHCYMQARNPLVGVFIHLAISIGGLFLLLPPVRRLMAKMVPISRRSQTFDEAFFCGKSESLMRRFLPA